LVVQSVRSPAGEVGREDDAALLQVDRRFGAHLDAMQPENTFAFLDSGFDGLITNDKFCFSRWDALRLSWWRRPLRFRRAESQRCDTLLDEDIHPGGTHEAGVGHGLGLSIVRRIVEKLGGQVGVDSAGAGKGCTFWFVLPFSTWQRVAVMATSFVRSSVTLVNTLTVPSPPAPDGQDTAEWCSGCRARVSSEPLIRGVCT
jgi:hypothetical protein